MGRGIAITGEEANPPRSPVQFREARSLTHSAPGTVAEITGIVGKNRGWLRG